jgi:hypothetical protein
MLGYSGARPYATAESSAGFGYLVEPFAVDNVDRQVTATVGTNGESGLPPIATDFGATQSQ